MISAARLQIALLMFLKRQLNILPLGTQTTDGKLQNRIIDYK